MYYGKPTKLELIISLLVLTPFLYFSIAVFAWQYRNPKANKTTVFTHFNDVIHFRALDKFN